MSRFRPALFAGVAAVAVAGLIGSSKPADAHVFFSVGVGLPVYGAPYAYPYYAGYPYPYAYPYAYGPAYYGYGGPVVGFGWGGYYRGGWGWRGGYGGHYHR